MPPGKGHSYSEEIYAEVSASEVSSCLQYRRGGWGRKERRESVQIRQIINEGMYKYLCHSFNFAVR